MAHDFLTRPEPRILEAEVTRSSATFEIPATEIREIVLDGEVVLLKDVFNHDQLRVVRETIYEWGQSTPSKETTLDETKESYHCHETPSPEEYMPNLYHFYCFHDLLKDNPPKNAVHSAVAPFFERMKVLYNTIMDTNYPIAERGDDPFFHPQVMHYPPGGGFFDLHRHSYEPMKMSMIASMSEQGVDYDHGGPRFMDGNTVYDLRKYHDIGDIALFRYDLPHSVTPVDSRKQFEWTTQSGRWSMLMPLH